VVATHERERGVSVKSNKYSLLNFKIPFPGGLFYITLKVNFTIPYSNLHYQTLFNAYLSTIKYKFIKSKSNKIKQNQTKTNKTKQKKTNQNYKKNDFLLIFWSLLSRIFPVID
jgi:hypothetical protein